MKRLTLAVALVAVLWSAAPASAGGSSFLYDQPSYRPGEQAFGWSTAYDLEQFRQEGPFAAWLVPVDDHAWGEVPAGAVFIGRIVPHTGPYEPANVISPNHLTLDFTVPDLPPGEYTMVHCNQPCTTSIQEVTWGGSFRIVAPRTPTPPTTMPPPPTTVVAAAPLVASTGSGGPPSWLPLVLGAAVVVGCGVSLLWLLAERRTRQPTVKPT
jgi:hypothetical protein